MNIQLCPLSLSLSLSLSLFPSLSLVFGQAKLCKYNGQHYCFECHRDDERVIPARVLYNWDFRRHRVSIASSEFLDSIEHSLMLDVHDKNKALYMYIPALEEARVRVHVPDPMVDDLLTSVKCCMVAIETS